MNRQFWRAIVANQYQLPDDAALVPLTNELLGYLTAPDSELRETFAYDILARWIIVYRYHTEDDLRELAHLLREQMIAGAGEADGDGVFSRASAAGILALIVYRDTQEKFLNAEAVKRIADEAGRYLVQEPETRAYIPQKGWVNACSNTADLLRYLAYNTRLDAEDLLHILHRIAAKVLQSRESGFMHDEEDRLAKAVLAVLSRSDLPMPEASDWLTQFLVWSDENRPEPQDYDAEYYRVHHNIKQFLRALLVQARIAPRMSTSVQQLEPDIVAAVRAFSL